MTMPETTINKNHCIISWKNNIWFTGHINNMKPISESFFKKEFSYQEFWRGIFPPYPTHIITAGYFIMHIHNTKIPNA